MLLVVRVGLVVLFAVDFAAAFAVTLEVTFGVALVVALVVALNVTCTVGVADGFLVAANAVPFSNETANTAIKNFLNHDPI